MRGNGELHLGEVHECEKIQETCCKCKLAKNFDNKIQKF